MPTSRPPTTLYLSAPQMIQLVRRRGLSACVATGAPRLLSELTLTTAIRTAAMSALAAQVLARPGSRSMALIGNGAQSEFQAIAFRDLVGVREVRLYDTDPAASAKLAADLQGQGLTVRICESTALAVRGAHIVTTVTADKTHATILTPQMIEPGKHINAVRSVSLSECLLPTPRSAATP